MAMSEMDYMSGGGGDTKGITFDDLENAKVGVNHQVSVTNTAISANTKSRAKKIFSYMGETTNNIFTPQFIFTNVNPTTGEIETGQGWWRKRLESGYDWEWATNNYFVINANSFSSSVAPSSGTRTYQTVYTME